MKSANNRQLKKNEPRRASLKARTVFGMIVLGIAASAVMLVLQVRAQSSDPSKAGMQTATGQYITPTAVPGAVQQLLNPGLLSA
jgi:hypothetical protein